MRSGFCFFRRNPFHCAGCYDGDGWPWRANTSSLVTNDETGKVQANKQVNTTVETIKTLSGNLPRAHRRIRDTSRSWAAAGAFLENV